MMGCFGQNKSTTIKLDKGEKQELIDNCISEFKQHYVNPDVVDKMEKLVRDNISKGVYNNMSNLRVVARQIHKDFRLASNDRHIWIDIMENLPVENTDVSIQEKINVKRKTNFGFPHYELLSGNVAYLCIENFNDLNYARETASHVMNLLSNSDAIILDLRSNHGGHGNMVEFLCSYFFDKKMQLNSLYFTAVDSLVTSWTSVKVPGKKLLKQKVYILTSENTTSAAESFTLTMKNYKRALIVGDNTRGAAHWKETFKLPDLGIFLEIPVAKPINPVTGKGWEAVGVQPDVIISPDEALQKAHVLALEELNKIK